MSQASIPWTRPILGHEQMYGSRLSVEQTGRWLVPLDPEFVLASSGFLTALIVHDDNDRDDVRLTATAQHLLFPVDRIEKSERLRARFRKRGTELMLIGEHALTVLARQALLRARGTMRPHDGLKWQKQISSAILAVNDIWGSPPSVDLGAFTGEATPEQRLLLFRMFLPQLAATRNQDSAHALARAKRMFVELPPTMRGDAEWIDFAGVVESKFGVTVEELAMCGHFLAWSFATQLQERVPRSIPLSLLTVLGLEQRVIDAAMPFYSHTFADAVAAEEQQLATNGRFEPFDTRALISHPVICFGDRMVAPAHRLIMNRVNAGLYYVLLDAVPREKIKSQAFFNFVGKVFERYCGELLERIANATGAGYVANPLPDSRGKRIDGAVVDSDGTASLFEFKSGMFNLPAGMHADEKETEANVDRVFTEAAIQLRDTVRDIRKGASLTERHKPSNRRFAIVVTQYPISSSPLLDAVVRDRMASCGESMSEFDGTPLLFLHISELEVLEPVLASKRMSLGALLGQWAEGQPRHQLHNFIYAQNLGGTRNPWLNQIANEWLIPWKARIEMAKARTAI